MRFAYIFFTINETGNFGGDGAGKTPNILVRLKMKNRWITA